MSGPTTDLLDGLMDACEARGVPLGALYGTGLPDGVGVPDTVAAFADYSPSDDPSSADSMTMVQVRVRSQDPSEGRDLDDQIADALLGRFPVTLSTGIRLQAIERTSGAPIGRDSVGRWERTSNYQVRYHRPGPHRL